MDEQNDDITSHYFQDDQSIMDSDFDGVYFEYEDCNISDNHVHWSEQNKKGSQLYDMKQFRKALHYHRCNSRFARNMNNLVFEAESTENVGICLIALKQNRNAHFEYCKLLKLSETLADQYIKQVALYQLEKLSKIQPHIPEIRIYELIANAQNDRMARNSSFDENGRSHCMEKLGRTLYRCELYEEAIVVFNEILEESKQVSNKYVQLRMYLMRGHTFFMRNCYDYAIKSYMKALNLVTEMNRRTERGPISYNLYQIYNQIGDVKKALKYLNLFHLISTRLDDQIGLSLCCKDLMRFHELRGDIASALTYAYTYLHATIKTQCRLEKRSVTRKIRRFKFILKQNTDRDSQVKTEIVDDDDDDTVIVVDQLVINRQSLGENPLLHDNNRKSWCERDREAKDYFRFGDFKSAIEIYSLLLNDSRSTIKDCFLEAKTLYNLGFCHRMTGDQTLAITYFEDALKKAQKINESQILGKILYYLGKTILKIVKKSMVSDPNQNKIPLKNQLIKAVDYMKESLRITEFDYKPERTIAVVAYTYCMLGDISMALNWYRRKLSIIAESNDNLDKKDTHEHIAFCYSVMRDYFSAINHYEEALKIANYYNNINDMTRICYDLANVHKTIGNLRVALFFFQNFLEIAEWTNDRLAQLHGYWCLAYVYYELHDYKSAFEYTRSHYLLSVILQQENDQTIARRNVEISMRSYLCSNEVIHDDSN